MTILTYPTPRARHRATRSPLVLTRRGRIVRDIVAGALILGTVLFATELSHAFFTVVVWAGNIMGLAS